jgi:hypothetical protein
MWCLWPALVWTAVVTVVAVVATAAGFAATWRVQNTFLAVTGGTLVMAAAVPISVWLILMYVPKACW